LQNSLNIKEIQF